MFEVEKILEKRIVSGQAEYFLKWKGYGARHNSWEPEENLEIPAHLIEAFERQWEEKEKKKKPAKNAKKKRPAPTSVDDHSEKKENGAAASAKTPKKLMTKVMN